MATGTFSAGGQASTGKMGSVALSAESIIAIYADGPAKVHLLYVMPESGNEVVHKVLHAPQDLISAWRVPKGTYDVDVAELADGVTVYAEYEN